MGDDVVVVGCMEMDKVDGVVEECGGGGDNVSGFI